LAKLALMLAISSMLGSLRDWLMGAVNPNPPLEADTTLGGPILTAGK
jgi:hypothetical protein